MHGRGGLRLPDEGYRDRHSIRGNSMTRNVRNHTRPSMASHMETGSFSWESMEPREIQFELIQTLTYNNTCFLFDIATTS